MIFTKRHQQGSSSPRSQNDMPVANQNNIDFKPYKVDNTTRQSTSPPLRTLWEAATWAREWATRCWSCLFRRTNSQSLSQTLTCSTGKPTSWIYRKWATRRKGNNWWTTSYKTSVWETKWKGRTRGRSMSGDAPRSSPKTSRASTTVARSTPLTLPGTCTCGRSTTRLPRLNVIERRGRSSELAGLKITLRSLISYLNWPRFSRTSSSRSCWCRPPSWPRRTTKRMTTSSTTCELIRACSQPRDQK